MKVFKYRNYDGSSTSGHHRLRLFYHYHNITSPAVPAAAAAAAAAYSSMNSKRHWFSMFLFEASLWKQNNISNIIDIEKYTKST